MNPPPYNTNRSKDEEFYTIEDNSVNKKGIKQHVLKFNTQTDW